MAHVAWSPDVLWSMWYRLLSHPCGSVAGKEDEEEEAESEKDTSLAGLQGMVRSLRVAGCSTAGHEGRCEDDGADRALSYGRMRCSAFEQRSIASKV